MLILAFLLGSAWSNLSYLQENLIRLHVVADSDSQEDQQCKLMVKDAVVAYLSPLMAKCENTDEAAAVIYSNLEHIQTVAQEALSECGSGEDVSVSVDQEYFDTRTYETFSLPAGIYNSLRIRIGSGQGRNWWCVAFPALCVPASEDSFAHTAVSAGFTEELTQTLVADGDYELEFLFMDCIGKLEKLFWKS